MPIPCYVLINNECACNDFFFVDRVSCIVYIVLFQLLYGFFWYVLWVIGQKNPETIAARYAYSCSIRLVFMKSFEVFCAESGERHGSIHGVTELCQRSLREHKQNLPHEKKPVTKKVMFVFDNCLKSCVLLLRDTRHGPCRTGNTWRIASYYQIKALSYLIRHIRAVEEPDSALWRTPTCSQKIIIGIPIFRHNNLGGFFPTS